MMNTLLWQVPVGALATVLTARFLAAPYQMHKEDAEKALAERMALQENGRAALALGDSEKAESNSTIAKLVEELEEIRNPKLDVTILQDARPLVRVRIVNHRDKERRIAAAWLSLVKFDDSIENFRWTERPVSSKNPPPFVMQAESRTEIDFYSGIDGLVFHGIKSFTAKVELETGQILESKLVDLSGRAVAGHVSPMERSLKRKIERRERIEAFVKKYGEIHATTHARPMGYSPFINFAHAGILTLENESEVREACDLIEARNLPQPFKESDFSKKILAFFNSEWGNGISPGGPLEWNIQYFAWFDGLFGERQETDIMPPSQVVDKAEPMPEPSSPECPETDTHCSDC